MTTARAIWGKTRALLAGLLVLSSVALAFALPHFFQRRQFAVENVLLVMVDTLRADHLGFMGYERNTSPNLDRFAADATVFEATYSHSPWTMPSTASILTSLPPRDHGITEWRQPLPLKHLTLAEHLRDHGFHTSAHVSHVIFRKAYHFDQGFEQYDTSALNLGNPHEVSSAEHVSDSFIAALDRGLERPFFVWLHYFDPHFEYIRHREFDFGDRPIDRYDSEIRETDEQIGRVFDALRRHGLWEKTVVVFIADHGEEFQDHGGHRHSDTLYDEVIHVPLVIRVPGFQPARFGNIIAESDVAPTLCRLLGVPVPDEFIGQPIRFAPGGFTDTEDRTVISETLRFADKRSVRMGRWKYIQDRARRRNYLFDIERDPRERRNLVRTKRRTAEVLQAVIDEHYEGGSFEAETQDLDEELRQQLEALGYL